MPKLAIPKAEFERRTGVLRQKLRESGFDGLLAVSGYGERDGNVCYLCGHKNAFPYSVRSDAISGLGYSAFVVPIDGKTTLISPLGFCQDLVVGIDSARTGMNLAQDVIKALDESCGEKARVAVAGSDVLPITYMEAIRKGLPEVTLEPADDLLTEQRMIKSENELRLLRQASKVADNAVRAALQSIKPGMTESDIGTIARKKAMEAGADYVVRDRIQSGSEIGKLRWPFASQKRVRKGELVSIDFVGWVNGYGFDILRVGCVGRLNREQRLLLEAAGEATEVLSNALSDNTSIGTAIEELKAVEHDGFKVEPFGHGIGLEIVENPYLLPEVEGTVRRNMVLCVEPTVGSLKGSASIENELVVTASKPEVLTRLPLF
jgi:Xaa-Pro aminopeptidase